MTSYNSLKKIIPPDQALANEALSRSLRQVKQIFNADLPTLGNVVSNLETTKDLDLINALDTPIPTAVGNVINSVLATGTGPGNAITTNDLIGTAAGATHNDQLPVLTDTLNTLQSMGALDNLTGNGGSPSSSQNGVYTVMSYCLANAYATGMGNTVVIPSPLPGAGTYSDIEDAFANGLIPAANTIITSIATTYSDMAITANDASNAMAQQLNLNVVNCTAAGIDIGNVVNDIANANLVANSLSSSLGLASQFHDLGLQVEAGGPAQFFEAVANTNALSGQAVISSMREGRNLALLQDAGIAVDTQISDINTNTPIANNLGNAQFTVSEATANIIL